jgi:hypothetical protein
VSEPYTYDVAFSFLGRDEPLARRLHDRVRGRVSTFMYSDAERQTQLAGTDGAASFATVYGKDARTVVVLYRVGWGTSGFTSNEETAIRNRAFERSWDFATFIPLDVPPQVPEWLPRTRLWLDLERYGEEGAAAVIESRVQAAGGTPREETAIEIMARQRAERDAAMRRTAATDDQRRKGLGPLLVEIRKELSEIVNQSGGMFTLAGPEAHLVGVTTPWYHLTLEFIFQRAVNRGPRDGDLIVGVWEGSLREMPGVRPKLKEPFVLEAFGDGTLGWRSVRDPNLAVLTHRALADWGAKRLIEFIDLERARGR